ncbi:MAG: response receiver-modulated diguanylate cyclase [Deltaproteobacteria bacterium]|nr:response receiver-modulated diguanylate cyclase [Deltaproteobacteria bacterium]
MKTSRILVLKENAGPEKDFRLTVLDHTVEFEYREPGRIPSWKPGNPAYAAVAVPIAGAKPDLVDALSEGRAGSGPVFLYRGDPPLHEMARWVIWETPAHEGVKGSVADRLLSESLEYYSMASLYHQCLRMMASPDEEQLLSQITETFLGELSSASCVVWLAAHEEMDEMMIASARGSIGIDSEGSRFFLSQSGIAESVWKGAPFQARPESHLYVPLRHQERVIGLVKLGERNDRKPYGEKELRAAQVIADYAASALHTVNRLGRIDKIPLRDPETGVHSAPFLEDYFDKERHKAIRFHRPLSVLFLQFENLSFLVEQTRENIVSGALVSVVENMRKAHRDSDLLARQEANRFCIVLPETDAYGAMLAIRRLRKAIREKNRIHFLGTEFTLQPFFMSAVFPRDGRDFAELARVAEEKQARQQKSPLHRLRISDRTFWEAFDVLVGKPDYYELLRKGEDVSYFQRIRRDLGRNGYFSVPRENYLRILESVAQDVSAAGKDRGVAIIAGPTPEIYKQVFLSFQTDAPTSRNVFILGQGGSTRFDARNLLYVSAEDDLLKDREVILYLKGNGAYGLFGTDRGAEVEGFNTADEWLVEAMIEKVQEMYLLQRTF